MRKILPMVVKILLEILFILIVVFVTTFGLLPNKSFRVAKLTKAEIETREYIKEIVRRLASDIGIRNYRYPENLENAKTYVMNEFKKLGYVVELQSYSVKGQEFSNIIATRHNDPHDAALIIGAHYDSCFNPGADDNASGVAGVLALARIFSLENSNLPIRFAAFVNEEPPFFQTDAMGSRVYTQAIKKDTVKIKGAVILEMIGYYARTAFSQRYLPLLGFFYPNRGNFIGIVGNPRSLFLVNQLKARFKENTAFPVRAIIAPGFIPGINFSDHWSFWQEGFPAVMITDTAYLRNPHYHKQSDLPETLDYDSMAIIVHGLKKSVQGLLTN